MKKDKQIVLHGRAPCAGYDCSTAHVYVTLTNNDIIAIGNRYLELVKETMNDRETTNKNS